MSQPKRAALAAEAYERAYKYELDYGCCPQCVLATVQETVGFVDDATIKAGHGLSGGGGMSGVGVCGALSGGLLALSCKRGRDRDKFERGKFVGNFQLGNELVKRFQDTFGGVNCAHLQKQFTGRTWNMWDADEYRAFDQARGDQCAKATALVTKWVVEML
jgi:C_GCAxxG_C_C family probable redox protein